MEARDKLTLRLERNLIRRAKRIARQRGKSVSRIVADYFRALGEPAGPVDELPPVTRSLLGILSDRAIDETDYRRHQETKHR